jgi:hypothetical protein
MFYVFLTIIVSMAAIPALASVCWSMGVFR